MERYLEWGYSALYILLLGGFLVPAVLAAGEEVPPFARDPPVCMPLRRLAVFWYRRLLELRQGRRRAGKDLVMPGEEDVQKDLAILYPSLKARRQEIRYQIIKIERVLLLLFAGLVLAGAVHVRALHAGILQEDGRIERSAAGGEDKTLSVKALPAAGEEDKTLTAGAFPSQEKEDKSQSEEVPPLAGTEKGKGTEQADPEEESVDYGTYTVIVHARQYTRAEAETRAREILRQFPASILGENTSPDQIRTPLSMPPAAGAQPFSISWESSRYAVLDTDGSIFNAEYTQQQAEKVELTVFLTCGEYQFSKTMAFTVRAPLQDEEEKLRGTIGEALKAAEKDSAEQDSFTLPSAAGGRKLVWKEEIEDVSAGVLVLGIVAAILLWYVTDYRLHERIRMRNRQMAVDYPQFISRIVLYMGAGMSVRNVFYKCAADYREKRERNNKNRNRKNRESSTRYLYEEILLVCNELDSGIPEAEAYLHFGRRCRSRQYTKLCSLLVQNLRRGSDTLLQVLQEEARSSFEERKNLAREMGEEAGTKLLLPMMMMLSITMLIIIVPAYFSFSV